MNGYAIVYEENGLVMGNYPTIEEAQAKIKEFEDFDKLEDQYEENAYEIYPKEDTVVR